MYINTLQSNYDFIRSEDLSNLDMSHKLFCTFTSPEKTEEKLLHIKKTYTIIFEKVFILEIEGSGEYAITYNIDPINLTVFPEDTILVHRKKESNTLYTINAINQLIKKLNGGYLDKSYQIPWNQYRNSLLLTKDGHFRQLETSLVRIEKI